MFQNQFSGLFAFPSFSPFISHLFCLESGLVRKTSHECLLPLCYSSLKQIHVFIFFGEKLAFQVKLHFLHFLLFISYLFCLESGLFSKTWHECLLPLCYSSVKQIHVFIFSVKNQHAVSYNGVSYLWALAVSVYL